MEGKKKKIVREKKICGNAKRKKTKPETKRKNRREKLQRRNNHFIFLSTIASESVYSCSSIMSLLSFNGSGEDGLGYDRNKPSILSFHSKTCKRETR